MKSLILKYSTLFCLIGAVAWLVSSPSWEPVVVALGLLATFVTLDERLSAIPKIEGRWEYTVVTGGLEVSHKGDCYIQQKGDQVRLQGTRRYTCSLTSRRKSYEEVSVSWESSWAELCDDSMLRFEYHIAIAEPAQGGKHIQAICRLRLATNKPTELIGNYYMLPPFEESTLNCKWGTITFNKIAMNAKLSPPDGYALR